MHMKTIITIQHTQSIHHTNGMVALGQIGRFRSLANNKPIT